MVGFKRIHLKAGESKKLSIEIKADDMALFNVKLKKVIEPGEFEVIIGDHQITEQFMVSK